MSAQEAAQRIATGPAAAALGPESLRDADRAPRLVSPSFRPRDYLLRRTLAVADLAGLLCAIAVTLAVSPTGAQWPAVLLLPVPAAFVVLFRVYGLYERDVKRLTLSVLDDLPQLFHALLLGTLLLWAYLQLLDPPNLSFVDVAVFGVTAIAAVSVCRLVARRAFLRIKGAARVLIVGSSALAPALVRKMRHHPEYGLEPVGSIAVGSEALAGLRGLGRLGETRIGPLTSEHRIDRVIIASQEIPDEPMMELVRACGAASVKLSILPRHVDALGPSLQVDDIEGLTMLGLNPLVLPRASRLMKRSLDLAGAAIGLALLAPLLAATAIAVRLDSPGPALFRQRRIGRGGEVFTVLKFRTMVTGAERLTAELQAQSSDPAWLKLDRDPRVTRVGRLLRVSSFDEIPQLWNVLRGEMSLVGPRPLSSLDDEQVTGWLRARLDLAPGVTGMWQVMGRTEIPFAEMLKLDCVYVTNWSLWLDVKLIARTVPAVFARRGAN